MLAALATTSAVTSLSFRVLIACLPQHGAARGVGKPEGSSPATACVLPAGVRANRPNVSRDEMRRTCKRAPIRSRIWERMRSTTHTECEVRPFFAPRARVLDSDDGDRLHP